MKKFNHDYYSILHISKKSSLDKVKSAYKKLAIKYHPDRNRSPEAEDKMKLINEAYEVLGNLEIRVLYDAQYFPVIKISDNQEFVQNQQKPPVSKKAPKNNTSNLQNNSWFSVKGAIIIFAIILFSSLTNNESEKGYIPPDTNFVVSSTPVVEPTEYIIPTNSVVPTINRVIPIYSPSPYLEPTIDCIGPDGKHLFVTKKVCEDFNNAWKPKPSPTSTNPCDNCPQNSHCSFGSCLCNDSYKKNYSNNQCEPCPNNSHGSYGSCTCNDGYEKNYSTDQCIPCPSNSHGSYGSCTCNDGYQKNYSNNLCEQCPSNSHGSFGTCMCNNGYSKNYSTGQCDSVQ